MLWSKEEKAISDTEFPFRVMLNVKQYSNEAANFLKPTSDVLNWLFENIGNTVKAPRILMRNYSKASLKSSLDGKWMLKTQGRNGYKFYFRNYGDAVAFKLVFADKYNARLQNN